MTVFLAVRNLTPLSYQRHRFHVNGQKFYDIAYLVNKSLSDSRRLSLYAPLKEVFLGMHLTRSAVTRAGSIFMHINERINYSGKHIFASARCDCDAVVVVVFTCAVYRRSIRKMCRVRKKLLLSTYGTQNVSFRCLPYYTAGELFVVYMDEYENTKASPTS